MKIEVTDVADHRIDLSHLSRSQLAELYKAVAIEYHKRPSPANAPPAGMDQAISGKDSPGNTGRQF